MSLAATAVVINSLSPSSGPLGTVITIAGSGFLGATSANSGLGVSLPSPGRWVTDGAVKVISATQVQYTMPQDGGTGQLFIGNPQGGTGWAPALFTVTGGTVATVPTVPSGFTAAAGNKSVALAWSSSSGATSYHVKRATTSGGPYTQVAVPTSASFSDTTVVNGTKYYYVVSALDTAGESANSAQVSATPVAATLAPAAPSGVAATAGNAQVSLTWATDSGATSYHVKRSTTSGGPYTQVGAPTATADIDTGLTNGTTYYYVVSGINTVGESANSAQVNAAPSAGTVTANVTVTVTPSSARTISPLIYGVNGPAVSPLAVPYASVTLNRLGGNRWTAYNWQNNASNAGSDYLYENDNLLSSSTAPLAGITPTVDTDRTNNVATLITLPMLGYVAADVSGPVSVTNPIQTSRFKSVVFAKGSAFTATPSNANASVYDDEMVWALNQHYAGEGIFSSTPAIPPVLIELDNEPDIWSSTHQEIETATEISSSAFFTKSIALSTAVKKQFPQATIMGPANYGFAGFFYWQGTWAGASTAGYDWFLDGYLNAVNAAAKTLGNTLVDAYSLHWYSQVTDSSGTTVTGLTGSTLSADSVQAVVQSPRSLWDTSYVENSWIAQDTGIGAIKLIPRVLDKIAHAGVGNQYAVSKMTITEYFNGGNNHIAGTLAQADNLGIFGAQGLYAATLWPIGTAPYPLGAFASFRNFDGAGHSFGNKSVAASSSNIANVSAYVSTDSTRPGRVVMVLINRSVSTQITAVTGQPLAGTAHVFRTTAASASAQGNVIAPVAAGSQAVSGSTLTVTLPALSVTTVDIY